MESVCKTRKSVFCINTDLWLYTIYHLEKEKCWWYYIDTKKKPQCKGRIKSQDQKALDFLLFLFWKVTTGYFLSENNLPLQVHFRKIRNEKHNQISAWKTTALAVFLHKDFWNYPLDLFIKKSKHKSVMFRIFRRFHWCSSFLLIRASRLRDMKLGE